MKSKGLIIGIAVAAISLAGSMVFAQGMRHEGHRGMHHMYDASKVETIKGEVTGIETVGRSCCGAGQKGLHATVKTDKETLLVMFGPEKYVAEKIKIAKGDTIEVTGARTTWDNKPAIIAKEVKKGATTVQLRKDNGTPLWAGEGMRRKMR